VELRAIHENCSGCGVCRLVCALENFRETNPAKAALRIEGRFPGPGDYRIHLCDQCGQCAEVCPVEAIQAENGVYGIDADECTACMACVEACPHGVLFVHTSSEIPFKCTLCGACAELCPTGALTMENPES
jgi:NAD-dependent dihydropyrimidine dehydrogenase PreA subunit